jgi:hypothetical protein
MTVIRRERVKAATLESPGESLQQKTNFSGLVGIFRGGFVRELIMFCFNRV